MVTREHLSSASFRRLRVDPSSCLSYGPPWEACVCAQLQPKYDMGATVTRNHSESTGTLGLGFQRLPTTAPIAAPATTPMHIHTAMECVAAPIATPTPIPTAIQTAFF